MRGPWQTSFGLHPVESPMVGGQGLSNGSVDGVAGYEARGKQDSAQKATTATTVKTVDKKSVPHVDNAAQTGRQATMVGETVTSSK